MKVVVLGLVASMAVGCGVIGEASKKAQKIDEVAPELTGTWKTSCFEAGVLDLARGERTFDFGLLGDFKKNETLYLKSNCDTPDVVYETEGSIAEVGELEENHDIKKINFTVDKAFISVNSGAGIKMLNAMKICGKSDWSKGQRVEITDKDCGPFTVKKGDVVFDTFDVENENLYLGGRFFLNNTNDKADDRPDTVNQDLPHHKQ